MKWSVMTMGVALGLAGCINTSKPPATQPVTAIDAKQAEGEFWLKQPAVASAQSNEFFLIWDAAEHVAREYGFAIDRVDQRGALMTTRPLISKQIPEVWHNDVQDGRSAVASTLATHRRTIYFYIQRTADGMYRLEPKVLVERYNQEEHRITAAVSYDQVYLRTPDEDERTAEGRTWLAYYWYAVGRDNALERSLADAVKGKLSH